MDVFLETERLILRRFTPDDVELLVQLDADPAVMRFITGGRPTPREEIERTNLPRYLGYYARYPGYGFWAAIEKASGDFLGWFHLRPRSATPDDEPELGYRLRQSAWGMGYGTEGSRALVERAFADLGARRVWAETMAVNVGSRRVMEKAGLRLVRTFHQPWPDPIEGDEHGDVEYALTRAAWEQERATRQRLAGGEPCKQTGVTGIRGAHHGSDERGRPGVAEPRNTGSRGIHSPASAPALGHRPFTRARARPSLLRILVAPQTGAPSPASRRGGGG